MLVKQILVLFTVAVANTWAAANSHQTISDMNTLAQKTRVITRAVDNFNGGVPSGLRCARALYDAHSFSEGARQRLGDADPFADEDSQEVIDAWFDLHQDLLSAITAGERKAPAVKKAGFGYITQGMLYGLYNEKNRFEKTMRGQMSSNHTRMIQPSVDHIDEAFKRTLDLY